MKIACLQFATTVGDLENNIRKADTVLAKRPQGPLDLLVLPELALTGYDFPDLAAIQPFLEPTASGTSTKWALDAARRFNCLVTVGYPEVALPIALLPAKVSSSTVFAADHAGLIKAGSNYNSAVTVAPNGEIVAHYRKSFLYEADERWAQEGTGFHAGVLPLPWSAIERETKITMGICMDINPYKFTAPWTDYEFANHVVKHSPNLNILSMAWCDPRITPAGLEVMDKKQPHVETLSYLMDRFKPLIEAEGEGTILVCADRCGSEGDLVYMGTSTVLKVEKGVIRLWGACGINEEKCLVVDTEDEPEWLLRTLLDAPR